MTQLDEEEWEYVYDPTEKEIITFTVDLSAAPLGSSATASNLGEHPIQAPDEGTSNVAEAQSSGSQAPPKPKPPPTLQFLDLPSKSPYISYQGQVFTGTWGENLGSDLIFASTQDLPRDVVPVIQGKDGKWCLLGVSQTTLVAKPVELVKRSRLEIQTTDAAGTSVAMENGDTDTNKSKSRKPFTIVLQPDADAKQRRQAAYLEQLMTIKMARGEKDIVYIGKSMKYLDANGKKKKAPGFSKRDLDRMNEGALGRKNDDKRKKARVEASLELEQEAMDGLSDDDLENDKNDEPVPELGVTGEVGPDKRVNGGQQEDEVDESDDDEDGSDNESALDDNE